jgi:hypothetical protein
MLRLAMLVLFLSFNTLAETSWQEEVKSLLPPPLSTFTAGVTTLDTVQKSLGKAQLVNGSKYYWERGGLKYALEISFKSKKLSSIHFTFTGNRPSFENVIKKVNLKNFAPHPSKGKSAGRFLKYKEKNSELTLDPLSKTIYSVRLP